MVDSLHARYSGSDDDDSDSDDDSDDERLLGTGGSGRLGGRSGVMLRTMGSTSDMSLPEGMTRTMERDESEKLLSYTVDSESDMKLSGKYPDSLEGTQDRSQRAASVDRSRDDYNNGGAAAATAGARPAVTVSVTMPSVVDEEEYYDDQDASTLSNV